MYVGVIEKIKSIPFLLLLKRLVNAFAKFLSHLFDRNQGQFDVLRHGGYWISCHSDMVERIEEQKTTQIPDQ